MKGVSTRAAFRPQLPLGHVMVGSALLRGGHDVELLDADVRGLSLTGTLAEIDRYQPDCLLVGHPASTVGHPAAMRLVTAVRQRRPGLPIVYGGVHPTYHADEVLGSGCVDFVVMHEAETVTLDLVNRFTLNPDTASQTPGVLAAGHRAPSAPAIKDLDGVRPIWDGPWHLPLYRAFGRRSAVVQFSRGCPRRCSYCGQWDFWKFWRHRSVASFVEDVAQLSRFGTRLFWIADENWSIDRALFLDLLHGLRRVNRGHHMVVAMEAGHLIRDTEHHRLYREAGLSQIMIGVDGEDDDLLGANPKRFDDSALRKAIESLRNVGVSTIINHFMPAGRDDPAPELGRLRGLRADFYNTLHPTPHAWTAYGRRAARHIANTNVQTWDYRHPVLADTAWGLLRRQWQAKFAESSLNTHAALRLFLRGLRGKGLPNLAILSVWLAALVFVRELAKLILDTIRFILTDLCPRRRLLAKLRSRRQNQPLTVLQGGGSMAGVTSPASA